MQAGQLAGRLALGPHRRPLACLLPASHLIHALPACPPLCLPLCLAPCSKRLVSMLDECRSVEHYEKLNRISEGTYGVVYRWVVSSGGIGC